MVTYLGTRVSNINLITLNIRGPSSDAEKKPFSMDLSSEERRALESIARKYTSPYCDVIRAKIILLANAGMSNDLIAARLDTPRQIVSKWSKRFALARLPGLDRRDRIHRLCLSLATASFCFWLLCSCAISTTIHSVARMIVKLSAR
jgi:hypothetical protein